MSLKCPRCAKDLRQVKVGPVALDLCDACEGVWFDQGEMGRILDMGVQAAAVSGLQKSFETSVNLEEKPGAGKLHCPKCSQKLSRYFYGVTSKVLVDGCTAGCGLWIDDGEIRKIFEYAVSAAQPLDPETMQKLNARLDASAAKRKLNEEKFVDSLVTLDNEEGLLKLPGKLLQLLANALYSTYSNR
jgi:Zn-finger nucleic acid-binding protein